MANEKTEKTVATEAVTKRAGAPKGSKAKPGDKRLADSHPGQTILRLHIAEAVLKNVPQVKVSRTHQATVNKLVTEAVMSGKYNSNAEIMESLRSQGIVTEGEALSQKEMILNLVNSFYGTETLNEQNRARLETFAAANGITAGARGKTAAPATV